MEILENDFNETETREFITEALKKKDWRLKANMHYEYKITDGRVQVDADGKSFREKALFADYLLFAPNTQPLCVIEAKRAREVTGTGIQQAIEYANKLNAPFAASSNGKSFVFTSLLNGHQEEFSMEEFPTQAELTNFPSQFKTSETAVLFIAYITKRLKQNGRAAVIIPDGFLFGNDNASIAVKKVLLEEMNLHTIIRLPSSVFAPYTSITTNVL